jgi:G:T/U-mismatch repair DNA glycosylase
MISTEEAINTLWNAMPKAERDNLSRETFEEAVRQTRNLMLDQAFDLYEQGFRDGTGTILAPSTVDARIKTWRVEATAALPD